MQSKNIGLDSRDDRNWGWIFVSPFLIGFLIIFIQIIIIGVRFAFSDVSMGNGLSFTFTGIKNFHYALRVDAVFIKDMFEEIKTLLTTLPVILVFSMFVAVILNTDVWGKTVFRAIFFLPVILCCGLLSKMDSGNFVVSFMDSAATANDTNSVMTAMGDITSFLQNMKFSPVMIDFISGAANNIMEIVNRSGVQILIFLAGIQSVSPQLYEAAKVEGASLWVIFWKITLPMLYPMMIVNLIYTFVESITRDNTVLLTYIKTISLTKGQYGYASAMAWIYCISIALILIFILFIVYLCGQTNKKSKMVV